MKQILQALKTGNTEVAGEPWGLSLRPRIRSGVSTSAIHGSRIESGMTGILGMTREDEERFVDYT